MIFKPEEICLSCLQTLGYGNHTAWGSCYGSFNAESRTLFYRDIQFIGHTWQSSTKVVYKTVWQLLSSIHTHKEVRCLTF